jgi:regulator of protease activity HflC (stomatin/prohibitin superfamily)
VQVINVLIIIVGLGLALYFGSRGMHEEGKHPEFQMNSLFIAVAVLIVAFGLASSFGQVPSGYRGVVLRFGAPTGEVKPEGLYTVVPFITSVVLMNVQVQSYATDAQAASHDLQDVRTQVTLNYSLDPGQVVTIYRDLRQDYVERIISPGIQEAIKAATARFTAEQLITQRPAARDLLDQLLAQRLTQFGIKIEALSITNFSFSDQFNQAIEAKVTAEQDALRAQQVLTRVRFEAEQKVVAARAEAEALALQRQNVTAQLLQLRAIEKWDGKLPSVVGAGATLPVLGSFGPSSTTP